MMRRVQADDQTQTWQADGIPADSRLLGARGRMTTMDHSGAFDQSDSVAERYPSAARLSEAARRVYALLSPREVAVLLAAAQGAEDKEIAVQLGCTLSTVRTLWQRMYRKTQATSRRRLIATLWEKACHLASCHP